MGHHPHGGSPGVTRVLLASDPAVPYTGLVRALTVAGIAAFDVPTVLPDCTAKLQPNGWKMAVFHGRWRNLGSNETHIDGRRRTLVDNGGMLSNRIHTHEVAGSSPAPPTNPHLERGFPFSTSAEPPLKACAPLADAVEAFLLSRRVANCSRHTIGVYLTDQMTKYKGKQVEESRKWRSKDAAHSAPAKDRPSITGTVRIDPLFEAHDPARVLGAGAVG